MAFSDDEKKQFDSMWNKYKSNNNMAFESERKKIAKNIAEDYNDSSALNKKRVMELYKNGSTESDISRLLSLDINYVKNIINEETKKKLVSFYLISQSL